MSIYYKRTAIEDIQRATAYIRSTFQNEESARLVAAFLTGKITRLNDAPCVRRPSRLHPLPGATCPRFPYFLPPQITRRYRDPPRPGKHPRLYARPLLSAWPGYKKHPLSLAESGCFLTDGGGPTGAGHLFIAAAAGAIGSRCRLLEPPAEPGRRSGLPSHPAGPAHCYDLPWCGIPGQGPFRSAL